MESPNNANSDNTKVLYLFAILLGILFVVTVSAVVPIISNQLNYTINQLDYIMSVQSTENGTCTLFGNWSVGHADSDFGSLSNPTDGLISYYPLDGNAVDNAGSTNGTLVGTTNVTGQVGIALHFNATNSSVISLGNPSPLKVANKTVSFWMKQERSQVNGAILSSNSNNYYVSVLSGANRRIFFSHTNTSGTSEITYGTTNLYNFNEWTHITVVMNNSDSKTYISFYINGVFDRIQSYNHNPSNTYGNNWFIGQYNSANNYFNGSIDEFRIYNRSLTQSEITTLYETTQIGKLVSYYKLEGDAVDSVGGFDGVFFNKTLNVTGQVENAIRFNDSFIDVTIPVRLNGTITSDTLSAWIKPVGDNDATISSVVAYMGDGTSAPDNNDQISMTSANKSGNLIRCAGAQFPGTATTSSIGINIGQWHHVVCSFEYNTTHLNASLYIDGTFRTSITAFANSYHYNSSTLSIGRQKISAKRYFNGTIDEVMIFNRSLTQAEISQLYYEQSVGKWQKNETVSVTSNISSNFTSMTFPSDRNYLWGVNCTDTTTDLGLGVNISFSTNDTISPNITNLINYTNDRLTYIMSTQSTESGTCTLYGNWSGSWSKNSTTSVVQDTPFNFTSISFTGDVFNYLWAVNCTDESNNPSQSSNISFTTIDTNMPSFNYSIVTTFYTLDLKLNFSEASNVSIVGVGINDQVTSFLPSYQKKFTNLDDGRLYTFTVKIYDVNGNLYSQEIQERLPEDLAALDHGSGGSGGGGGSAVNVVENGTGVGGEVDVEIPNVPTSSNIGTKESVIVSSIKSLLSKIKLILENISLWIRNNGKRIVPSEPGLGNLIIIIIFGFVIWKIKEYYYSNKH